MEKKYKVVLPDWVKMSFEMEKGLQQFRVTEDGFDYHISRPILEQEGKEISLLASSHYPNSFLEEIKLSKLEEAVETMVDLHGGILFAYIDIGNLDFPETIFLERDKAFRVYGTEKSAKELDREEVLRKLIKSQDEIVYKIYAGEEIILDTLTKYSVESYSENMLICGMNNLEEARITSWMVGAEKPTTTPEESLEIIGQSVKLSEESCDRIFADFNSMDNIQGDRNG